VLRLQVQGVPILFVHSTGIGLELPTEEQRHAAVRQRLRACAMRRVLRMLLPAQENRGVVPAHERHTLQLEPGAATRVHTNVQFKRNKAKGPNPLSVKKKRTASPPPQRPSGEARISAHCACCGAGADAWRGSAQGGAEGERQRKRVRPRHRGAGEAAAQ